jgi:hypothetical protein
VSLVFQAQNSQNRQNKRLPEGNALRRKTGEAGAESGPASGRFFGIEGGPLIVINLPGQWAAIVAIQTIAYLNGLILRVKNFVDICWVGRRPLGAPRFTADGCIKRRGAG